jgi:hypothetical protein
MISLKRILREAFGDYYRKNKWVELPHKMVIDNADSLFDLVQMAYADKGGNLKVRSRNDIVDRSEINYWIAIDTDVDPDPDVAIGGRKTPAGTKLTVMGQDGGPGTKRLAITKMISLMNSRGFYAEVDTDLAAKFGFEPIQDEDAVREVLAGKKIKFLGNGVYMRAIAGTMKRKVLIGHPKVKQSTKK